MKNITITISAMVALLAITACQKPPEAQKAAAVTMFPVAKGEGKEYKLDLTKSQLKWIATKITGRHNGIIKIKEGSVWVKDNKITAGKFIADMNTITVLDLTGESKAKLEKHLRTGDFFEAGQYPDSVFEISSVDVSPNGHTIKGNLTARGVTHGITFDAKVVFDKTAPKSATATFNIDRQKWGVAYKGKPDDLISNTINLTVDLHVKK